MKILSAHLDLRDTAKRVRCAQVEDRGAVLDLPAWPRPAKAN
jgi:hypothetical protein